ncbi:TRAF family member-associated NF-kappa-B activator isoform X2 [Protopterus annectens]|uniref:TRAF family member-associated NF-kappa-B activator isoform X2 n=1 Tax=Protopterus annectens TaxID=7888 RepID=UPI001CFB4E26|nr:TRAF family member-associated NF-kappa-B activator isoform X2 [Protopterus annectens]
MDKTSAAQLNKAYEAFRQVYMERQTDQKQFKQKIREYEHCLKLLQDESLEQKKTILCLQSELGAGKGNVHGTAYTQENMTEDSERGLPKLERHELTVPHDQLFEKLKIASHQENYLKDELTLERNKVKKMEEELKMMKWTLESIVIAKDKEILSLKQQLMDSGRLNPPEMDSLEEKYETSDKSTRTTFHSPNSEISTKQAPSREEMECVFQEIKGEFDRLRALTRRQSAHLGKLKFDVKTNALISAIFQCELENSPLATALLMLDAEDQFSMPIQCTDVPPEQTERPFKSSERKYPDRDVVTLITPRGPGEQEDYSCYVLPLDKLDIKFPPPPDLDFLKSSTDKPVEIEAAMKTQQNSDLSCQALLRLNSSEEAPGIEINNIVPPVPQCDQRNKHLTDLNILAATNMDRHQLPNSTRQVINTPICKVDTSGTVGLPQAAERTVKGPQQALWKPFQNQDSERSNVCEFCHAVFPPFSISSDEFFRHLFLHLENPSKNGL